jgi:hypothetical protein
LKDDADIERENEACHSEPQLVDFGIKSEIYFNTIFTKDLSDFKVINDARGEHLCTGQQTGQGMASHSCEEGEEYRLVGKASKHHLSFPPFPTHF